MARPNLLPFLKWAGGKRWLAERVLISFPGPFTRYVEPFLGSGALFFALQPQRALLSDLNPRLIETYEAIVKNASAVVAVLEQHQKWHSSEYYYQERARKRRKPHTRAAQFIYLNRTCWNGLYRVNREGQFNVPIGTKSSVILDTDDFGAVARVMKNAELRCCDFEQVLEDCSDGDAVFVDPPYTVKHNVNGFIKYNETLFSWCDQIRLRDAVLAAGRRGAYIALTNADHPSIRELYQGIGHVQSLARPSVLAADPKFRASVSEVLITNW